MSGLIKISAGNQNEMLPDPTKKTPDPQNIDDSDSAAVSSCTLCGCWSMLKALELPLELNLD